MRCPLARARPVGRGAGLTTPTAAISTPALSTLDVAESLAKPVAGEARGLSSCQVELDAMLPVPRGRGSTAFAHRSDVDGIS